jgi:hypothetical protein
VGHPAAESNGEGTRGLSDAETCRLFPSSAIAVLIFLRIAPGRYFVKARASRAHISHTLRIAPGRYFVKAGTPNVAVSEPVMHQIELRRRFSLHLPSGIVKDTRTDTADSQSK